MTTLLERYENDDPSHTNEKILFRIVDDLRDRRGLRQEWDGIDAETQEQILETWLDFIEGKNL